MKKIALFLIILLFFSLAGEAFSAEKIAAVTGIVKGLQIKSAGETQWKKAAVWMPLSQGDSLKTGAGEKASILFADGTQLKIDSNTQVVIKEKDLEVQKGKIWLLVKGDKAGYKITTPSAVAGVEGTELEIEVDGETGESVLRVQDGEVTWQNEKGKVLVQKLMEAQAKKNQNINKPKKVNAEKIAQWKEKIQDYVKTSNLSRDDFEKQKEKLTELFKNFKNKTPQEKKEAADELINMVDMSIASIENTVPPGEFKEAHEARLNSLKTAREVLVMLKDSIGEKRPMKTIQKAKEKFEEAKAANQAAAEKFKELKTILREKLKGFKNIPEDEE